jgi:hypothetical protein
MAAIAFPPISSDISAEVMQNLVRVVALQDGLDRSAEVP